MDLDPTLADLIGLALRSFHVIAAITWIGHAFYFNWLDASLTTPAGGEREGVEGELWMVHSGGYYQVEKKSHLPNPAPEELHWFKWEAFLTWFAGMLLLIWMYYMSEASLLIDTSVREMEPSTATGIGIGVLVIGWLVYDGIYVSPLGQKGVQTTLLCFALLIALTFGLTKLFSSRGAFIHVGALLGTIMVGNVWFRIIPAQKKLLATAAGGGVLDPVLGKRAKGRSVHNNYLGYPVVAIMVSNHYPVGTYGHHYNWLMLGLLLVVGAGIRWLMNSRYRVRH